MRQRSWWLAAAPTYATRQRRVSDILNEPDTDFIVVRDAVFDDFGTTTSPVRAALRA